MATPTFTRRPTTVVSADVSGFVRLMEADELGTFARLMAVRHRVLEPAARRTRGRLVGASGDGFLLEFPRGAGDALRWGALVQRATAARDRRTAPDRRMLFRIGVHRAEVIAAGADLFGDGVNVAARVQRLAAPGEVWVTQPAVDAIGRDPLARGLEFLGARAVRNRDLAVPVWRLPARDGRGAARAGRGG